MLQKQKVQHGIAESRTSCTTNDKKANAQKILNKLSLLFAETFDAVEKEGFMQLVKKLELRHTLPKRKSFSNMALVDCYTLYTIYIIP